MTARIGVITDSFWKPNTGDPVRSINSDNMNEETKNHSGINNELVHIEGPAGAHVDFEGIEKASPLYPLDKASERSGTEHSIQVKDLGINSDGTNPGTEYEEHEVTEPDPEMPAITDLDEIDPEWDLPGDRSRI